MYRVSEYTQATAEEITGIEGPDDPAPSGSGGWLWTLHRNLGNEALSEDSIADFYTVLFCPVGLYNVASCPRGRVPQTRKVRKHCTKKASLLFARCSVAVADVCLFSLTFSP